MGRVEFEGIRQIFLTWAMNQSMQPVICLMGPTATGKTELAIRLVQQFPCEIVSVDSAMVYRDMNIGTAKPTPEELIKAPHQLIDLCDPVIAYSAGGFRQDAIAAMIKIINRGKIPLLVGGTMLYFHVLQNGMAVLPKAEDAVRESLLREAEKIGWQGLYRKLQHIDPKMAVQLHPNDSQRIQRALEIYEITGQTMTELRKVHSAQSLPYTFVNLIIEPQDRGCLHRRIEQRFKLMLKAGFLEEVAQLKSRHDLHDGLPSIRTVGYRQVWAYLNNEYSKEKMQERVIIATRQLAKRQLTWLRSWNMSCRFYFEDQRLFSQLALYLEKYFNENYY